MTEGDHPTDGPSIAEGLSEAIEEAIDHHVRAFTDGLAETLVGRTIVRARGEVWDGDGRWSFSLLLDDGSSLSCPGHCFAHGPIAEIVRMAGGVPECDPVDVGEPWAIYDGEGDE